MRPGVIITLLVNAMMVHGDMPFGPGFGAGFSLPSFDLSIPKLSDFNLDLPNLNLNIHQFTPKAPVTKEPKANSTKICPTIAKFISTHLLAPKVWFNVQRTPSAGEDLLYDRCNRWSFTDIEDSDCLRLEIIRIDEDCYSYNITGILTEKKKSKGLHYDFATYRDIRFIEVGILEFYVLATDSTTFALLYSCSENTGIQALVLSSTKVLSVENQVTIENVLELNGLENKIELLPIEQTACP